MEKCFDSDLCYTTPAETKELTIYSPLALAALILPVHTASIKNQDILQSKLYFKKL